MERKLIEETEAPTQGGFKPIRIDGLTGEDGGTINLVCYYLGCYFKRTPAFTNDRIEVKYDIEYIYQNGVLNKVKQGEGYITKDIGALVSFEVFDKTVFAQKDIDNPEYDVHRNPATQEIISITHKVGQIMQEGEEGNEIMIDNIIDIKPIEIKGQNDLKSRKVIKEAFEPLAMWYSMMGHLAGPAIQATMCANNNLTYEP